MTQQFWLRLVALVLVLCLVVSIPAAFAASVYFTDVSDATTAPGVEVAADNLFDRGITNGCNPPTNNLFCANDPVTRWQMALFLNRVLNISLAKANNAYAAFDGNLSTTGNPRVITPTLGLYVRGGTGKGGLTAESEGSASSIAAVTGRITSTTPAGFTTGLRGINNGTGGLGIGVWGSQAGSGWGVYGTAAGGLGVYGSATGGIGVYGDTSTGLAMYAAGTTGQTRDQGGWVKALVRQLGGALNRCYNSQASTASAANSCSGFSIAKNADGDYTLTLPFNVNDRYVSVTAESVAVTPRCCLLQFNFPAANQVRVLTWDDTGAAIDRAWHLAVY